MEQWREATTFWPPNETPPGLGPLVDHARGGCLGFYIGPGWFHLAAECHARIEREFPGYELLAVK